MGPQAGKQVQAFMDTKKELAAQVSLWPGHQGSAFQTPTAM